MEEEQFSQNTLLKIIVTRLRDSSSGSIRIRNTHCTLIGLLHNNCCAETRHVQLAISSNRLKQPAYGSINADLGVRKSLLTIYHRDETAHVIK